MKFLSDIAHYVNDKIEISKVRACDYVTTENMLPNRDGITENIVLPNVNNVTYYKHNDVLVSNIRPYFKKIWMADREGGCSNDILVFRINDENQVDKKYLYYLLSQDVFFDFMMSGANGTKMPRGNKTLIPNFLIPDYDITTQRHIADMLSAYDDLIENNRKQIKLLEEAAQRLYKEWFVELRFPGHEKVKVTDGVPEGWERKPISGIAEYLNGYAFAPCDWFEQGKPIIKIKEMNAGISKDTPRNSGENVPDKYLVKAGDILFSWSATLTAMIWNDEDGLLNQHLFKVIPFKGISREFVLQAIKNLLVEIQNNTTGSTMKHIQRGKLDVVKVIVPNDIIMKNFDSLTYVIREKILKLSKQIKFLQEARDRLLPKLMCGEIEV